MGSMRRSSNQQNNEESLELNINTPPTPDSPNSVLMMSDNPDLQSLLESENEATPSAAPEYTDSTMSQPSFPGQSAHPSEPQEHLEGEDASSIARQVLDNLIAENIFEEPEAKRLRLDPECLPDTPGTETEPVSQCLEQLVEMEQATPMETERTDSELTETEQGTYAEQPEQTADIGDRESSQQPEEENGSSAPNFSDDDMLFVRQLEVVLEENKRSKAFTQFTKSDSADEAQDEPGRLPQKGSSPNDFDNTSVKQIVEETSNKNNTESKESSNGSPKSAECCVEPKADEEPCPKSSLEVNEESKSKPDDSKPDDSQDRKRRKDKSELQKDKKPSKIRKTDAQDENKTLEKNEDTDDTIEESLETFDKKTTEKYKEISKKDDVAPTTSGQGQTKTEVEDHEEKDEERQEEKRNVDRHKETEEEHQKIFKEKKDDKDKGKGKKRQEKKYLKKTDKEKGGGKKTQDDANIEDAKRGSKDGDSSNKPEGSPERSSNKTKEETGESKEACGEVEDGEQEVEGKAGTSRVEQDEGLGGDSDGVSSAGSESTGLTLRTRPPTPAPPASRRSSRVHKYPERLIYHRKDQF